MKVNLEILDSHFIYDEKEIIDLDIKSLVPKMMMRRRLTRAAKILIYLANKCKFTQGKVVFGSAFGELDVTASIIQAIAQEELVSPTAFQNSVYNTAASYHSILHNNKAEVLTVSSFDKTSSDVLSTGALLAMQGEEIFLVAIETINTKNINEVNACNYALECGVAMRVKISTNKTHSHANTDFENTFIPRSLIDMVRLQKLHELGHNIIEVEL